MRISRKYRVADWTALDFGAEDGWQRGVDILADRIKSRVLDIVRQFEGLEVAGFIVLAVDCLLIETLQQFREGVAETPRWKGEEYFVKFLTETRFRRFFDQVSARKFYDHVRCGILHQSEVKGDSRVVIGRRSPLIERVDQGNGLVVNRKVFHRELVLTCDEYLAELRNPANADLREKFKRKMDHICRVGEDGMQ